MWLYRHAHRVVYKPGCRVQQTSVGHRRLVLSTIGRRCRLFMSLGEGGRAMAKFFSSPELEVKSHREVRLFLNRLYRNFLITQCRPREASVPKMSWIRSTVFTQLQCVTDTRGHTDTQTLVRS